MKKPSKKPRVIWMVENSSGRLSWLTYAYRFQAARGGKPIKFVEARRKV